MVLRDLSGSFPLQAYDGNGKLASFRVQSVERSLNCAPILVERPTAFSGDLEADTAPDFDAFYSDACLMQAYWMLECLTDDADSLNLPITRALEYNLGIQTV